MRMHVLFAVLLASSLIADTDAGWFRKLFRGAKRVAKKVGKFVRNHCSGLKCRIRFKRDVDMNQLKVSVTDSGNTTELRTGEDICALVETANMPFDGFAKGVVDMFFDEADQDKDKELTRDEFSLFAKYIGVYEQCLAPEPKYIGIS